VPIYEYHCEGCDRRQAIFYRSFAAVEPDPPCPACGGRHLRRLISRTAQVLSEDSRMDAMADDLGSAGVDENDPRSVARWARKMGNEMGGDELGEDFDQVVDELEEGGPPNDGPDGGDDDEF